MTGTSIDRAKLEGDLDEHLARARETEIPHPEVCLDVARTLARLGELDEAINWCCRVVDSGLDYRSWDTAARLLKRILPDHQPGVRRTARLAVVGSYTTDQLVDLLRLVSTRRGVSLDIYEAGFNQYHQEILDPTSGLYRHEPELVLVAAHEGELRLPHFSAEPDQSIKEEVARWVSLWAAISERSDARIIQTNFVRRPEDPFGHLSSRLPGARSNMIAQVNAHLGLEAGESVLILDCERLASLGGRDRWFDDRYWFRSKQAVGLASLPLMTQHMSALVASELGLSRKCLVLDLDGTVWGGVIGEDGVEGIRIGHGPDGEAFAAFQEYILSLKRRGVILAACSKNDKETAQEPFAKHPDMRLSLEDFAIFDAGWGPKPERIRRIAESLDLSLDALTFVDDQPAERDAVRRAVPEVDVITLPDDPAYYVKSLADYPYFETSSFTKDDSRRTETYQARAAAHDLQSRSATIEDFLASLEMHAVLSEFDDLHLPRITQLIGKTNQFNLTSRRRGPSAVSSMIDDPDVIHFYAKLSDRFADHGLVGVMIGRRIGSVVEIDTFLMSCRVIGRSLEQAMLAELASRASEMGCDSLKGVYLPTAKNHLVEDLYEKLGFIRGDVSPDEIVFEYRLDDEHPPGSPYITTGVK